MTSQSIKPALQKNENDFDEEYDDFIDAPNNDQEILKKMIILEKYGFSTNT